jgi:hypothetical protein
MLKIIWDAMNGKKLTTGTVMIMAVLVFKSLGMDQDVATQTATSIMLGVGAVLTLTGYIHRWIKAKTTK